MYYRMKQVDHWDVSVTIVRQGDVIGGGEVTKRYLPQYARTEHGPWHTFADLGFQRHGFETPSAAEDFLASRNPRYTQTFQGMQATDVLPTLPPQQANRKLTPAQERLLRQLFDQDPLKVLYSDVLRDDGLGRNPTFRALTRLGLVQYTHVSGNSFRARLTEKGIHYLHGELVTL